MSDIDHNLIEFLIFGVTCVVIVFSIAYWFYTSSN